MRQDKLIRSVTDQGIEGSLLAATKRAVMAGDAAAMAKILEQLKSLADIAVSTKDKALNARVQSTLSAIKNIVENPGGALVMQTKAMGSAQRSYSVDPADLEEITNSGPLGTIEGYGSTFGNMDFGGDIVVAGAFKNSLARWKNEGRLPVMLAVHDNRAFPIGRWDVLEEDSIGLRSKGTVANTARGREAWTLHKMTPSALDGLSIGYSTIRSRPGDNGATLLLELELFEVSLVGLPMNTRARLITGKSACDDLSESIKKLHRVMQRERSDNVLNFPQRGEQPDEKLLELARKINRTVESMRIRK